MKKIVAIDLDGTLLHSDCTISSYSKEVIAEAVKNGIMVVPTSGRSFRSIKNQVQDIEGAITDIQTLLAPITDRYFGTESGFSIQDIYDEIFQMEKEEIASVKEDLLKKADVSKSMFGSSPEEDREFLQLFSFICLLSFDVYLKKQMIEHMVDELASLAAPSDPKKKN